MLQEGLLYGQKQHQAESRNGSFQSRHSTLTTEGLGRLWGWRRLICAAEQQFALTKGSKPYEAVKCPAGRVSAGGNFGC